MRFRAVAAIALAAAAWCLAAVAAAGERNLEHAGRGSDGAEAASPAFVRTGCTGESPGTGKLGYLFAHVGTYRIGDVLADERVASGLDAMMGRSARERLMDYMTVQGPIEHRGFHMLLQGNAPHQGGLKESMLAIDLCDGSMEAAILHDGTLTTYTTSRTGFRNSDISSMASSARQRGRVVRAGVPHSAGLSSQGSPAFWDGFNDRLAWERWFASAAPARRSGAEWWAAQRSTSKPAPCTGLSDAETVAGCQDAQRRLAPADARRRTEPDYRRGWNAERDAASGDYVPFGHVACNPAAAATRERYCAIPAG